MKNLRAEELFQKCGRLSQEITSTPFQEEEEMKRTLFVMSAIILALTACGLKPAATPLAAYDQRSDRSAAPEMEVPAAMPAATMVASGAGKGGEAALANQPQDQGTGDRLVIQNADLSIVVADPKQEMDAIARLAEQMGGFVVSSNLYQTSTREGEPNPEGDITIRVPAAKLDQVLTQIKADATDVQSENRSGQDVTKEYVDLNSRLKNLEAAEAQLTKIMENAQKTQDVLDVFDQLTNYREQIEVVKGQIQYYEESAALSVVSVHLVAEKSIQPIEIGGWKPQGVARDAIQSLIYYLQGFVDFLIRFVLYFLPVLITIALPLYLIFLGLRFVFRKLRQVKAPTKGTEKEK
jgi:hypothetical protein